jgi:hypothetical protein
MDIKLLGPTGAAKQMWREGQSTESNPYTKGSDEHKRFNEEVRKLERQELNDMMGPGYA